MFHMFPVDRHYFYTTLSLVKRAKFALVVGIVMIVLGRASSSFKEYVSYLFCFVLKAVVIDLWRFT